MENEWARGWNTHLVEYKNADECESSQYSGTRITGTYTSLQHPTPQFPVHPQHILVHSSVYFFFFLFCGLILSFSFPADTTHRLLVCTAMQHCPQCSFTVPLCLVSSFACSNSIVYIYITLRASDFKHKFSLKWRMNLVPNMNVRASSLAFGSNGNLRLKNEF